jgi:hypothetical protein
MEIVRNPWILVKSQRRRVKGLWLFLLQYHGSQEWVLSIGDFGAFVVGVIFVDR